MRFQIDSASLMVGRKFTVFALFYFVLEGNFPSTSPRRAYIWRGLFLEFYGILLIYTSTGQNWCSVLLTEQKNITTKLKDGPGRHYKKD